MGEVAARALVEAVAARDDLVERHYLEVKSDVDLSTTLGAAKVAKYILGAANRQVELADRAFEGYGIMIVGVAPGATPGIRPVEVMEIETRVRPYLSAAGPAWDVVRVPVASDREVLLILVSPPKPGQDAFLCWREFSASGKDAKHNLRNGGIYVRAEGATRPATAEEISALRERGRGTKREVDLDVQMIGSATRQATDGGTLIAHIERTRERLIDKMVAAVAPESDLGRPPNSLAELAAMSAMREALASPAVTIASKFMNSTTDPEDRTPDQYRKSVQAWAEHATRSVPMVLDNVTAGLTKPVIVRLVNRTNTFYEDVELTVHLAGDVDGLEPREDQVPRDAWLPRPPRSWGPRSLLGSFGYQAVHGLLPSTPFVPGLPPRLTYENGGSIWLKLQVGDLRPRAAFETDSDEGFVVVVRNPEMATVRGVWALTARGHHERYEGDLSLSALPAVDASEMLSNRLSQEEK